jgi:Ca-activated chloride channel family protein
MSKSFFQRMHERDQVEAPINQALKAKLAQDLKLGRAPSWFNRWSERFRSLIRPLGSFALAGTLIFVLSVALKDRAPVFTSLSFGPVVDDWISEPNEGEMDQLALKAVQPQAAPLPVPSPAFARSSAPAGSAAPSLGVANSMSAPMDAFESLADATLGYSVGGAKDITTFREKIKNGYMPQDSDLTYEGLFYDYAFETGAQKPCTDLFCPSYARALVRDPLTGQEETYLSVGLNSNLKESDFRHPKTNFVVVLDISGSMSSPFDRYYTSPMGQQTEVAGWEASKTKMQIANEALGQLVDHLRPEDRLGIVLFSDDAKVAKPLRLLGETDRNKLKQHILELQPTNGTNMSAGFEKGVSLFREGAQSSIWEGSAEGYTKDYANRLIFITDAMPNQGEFGPAGLHGLVERYAAEGVQTTLLGVGVDFQTDLVEALTKVRGANYFSIHSAQDFKQRLSDDFDFLVTPLVYDLRLQLKGTGYAIDEAYGSPDVAVKNGEILHVRTLFPSKTQQGQTKGGLVLLKLHKTNERPDLNVQVSYEDTRGKSYTNETSVSFSDLRAGDYDNLGIRKGVLLTRYVRLLKAWLRDEPASQSVSISNNSLVRFETFLRHFKEEANILRDETLKQEQTILERLTLRNDQFPLPLVPQDDWRY